MIISFLRKSFFSPKTLAYSSPFVNLFAALGLILLATCQMEPDADSIIEKTIAVHGGDELKKVQISFDFRDIHYVIKHEDGRFQYERLFSDSTGKIHDILTNDGFIRLLDSDTAEVSTEFQKKYSNSINSVAYFALLPYGLDGGAVNRSLLGTTTIKGLPYYEILVTFDEEGGGEDFEDIFVYWINQQSNTMDYLAYAYHTEGGGTRFRESINPREIGEIRFQDYVNYDYKGDSTDLHTYETLFEENKLEELSRINLENIKVEN